MKSRIPVLYEDEHFTVFDKPPGLLVIPTPRQEKKTLMSLVNEQYPGSGGKGRLHPCHRLDRGTSGAILFARGKRNQQLLMAEFKRRAVGKRYIAFVHGRLRKTKGELSGAVSGFDRRKFAPRAPALSAVTRYKVLKVKKDYTVVEVVPRTGRTNQIRIHFKQIGHPLVGEDKYAFRKDFELRFRRVALHSRELSWTHPFAKKRVTVESPLAKDMEAFIAKHP